MTAEPKKPQLHTKSQCIAADRQILVDGFIDIANLSKKKVREVRA